MPRTTPQIWEGTDPTMTGGNYGYVPSVPPANMLPVTNVYWNPALGLFVGEYDDSGGASSTLQSAPPGGSLVITNMYWNPIEGKLIIEYEDEQ